jgi:CBS domain containing-hemolysin-like protein
MAKLVISVGIAIGVSFLCSLMEAALFAVSAPFVRALAEKKSRVGSILVRFKENVDRPISAILILNTIANTGGAAVAGAAAADYFGDPSLIWFSILFTLMILFISELVPKVLGANYNRHVAVAMAFPLSWIILALAPLIAVTRLVSKTLRRGAGRRAPEDEVRAMAAISYDEGSILKIEKDLIGNVLRLNDVTAGDIMTPRTVMFRKPETMPVREIAADTLGWNFSRVPLHKPGDVDEITGFVLRRDIFSAIAEKRLGMTLTDFSREIRFVPEAMPAHKLLNQFIQSRRHLFAVVDEYGALAGVVTLEDVLEFLLGKEIVDEFDQFEDMQELARARGKEALEKTGTGENAEADRGEFTVESREQGEEKAPESPVPEDPGDRGDLTGE